MKWLYKFSILALISISAFGQTPEKMSYQAIIRDNSGLLLENSNVSLKIVLKQGTPQGPNVYSESHFTTTNKNGLLSLEIGSGNAEKGHFGEIDWAKGPYFIETRVDPKGNGDYKVNGVSQMLSVPYALHAKSADNFVGKISPSQLPDFYTAEEVDNLILDIITQEVNASNFSGNYEDLEDKPVLFSGLFNDLKNKPELYDKAEIDRIIQNLEITGGSPQNLLIEANTLSISGGNSVSFENWDTNVADDFSGDYDDLENKPELYSKTEINNLIQSIETSGGLPQNLSFDGKILSISGGNSISFEEWNMGTTNNFDGKFESLTGVPELYNKTEIDDLIGSIGSGEGIPQLLGLDGNTLSISAGNTISFEGWDMNVSDDFDGKFESLTGIPELYNKKEIEDLISSIEGGEGISQLLNIDGNTLSISAGNTISFEGWDINSEDDFSGNYEDLVNRPELFSGNFKDLINVPEIYTKNQVDSLVVHNGSSEGTIQSLTLSGQNLSITGGNSISFEGWDMDVSDDFSGNYEDLTNRPELFTKDYNDLINVPQIYTKSQVDSLVINNGASEGTVQSLTLNGQNLSITGGNSISFEDWDMDVSDDFSGNYEDLTNRPELFTKDYNDLINVPQIYTKSQVDSLVINNGASEGTVQSLTLNGQNLSITGGNSISFEGWDINASDDFDGKFQSLTGTPELYNKKEIDDLLSAIEVGEAAPQQLSLATSTLSISSGNTISFEGWDIDTSDDFSGNYADLVNRPELFSKDFKDLINVPELYNKNEVDDLINAIEVGEASPQQLSLAGNTLSISSGNSISFGGWDMNASDDFSGNYADLVNRPELFSKDFKDLINVPELYNKNEVDDLINAIEVGEASPQQLSLAGNTLSISAGNSISFGGWDMNASDDFSGNYADLVNRPELFSKDFKDLINVPELYNKNEVDDLINAIAVGETSPQQLSLAGTTLSISAGNSISFGGWDMDATDDFDGNYTSLVGAPKIYTQEEVDSIKAEILKEVEANYAKKAKVFAISSARNVNINDVGNTVACTSSATLTIVNGFSGMQVGDVINLEVHGTTLTVKGVADVIINGKSGGVVSIGNNSAYTGGLIRKLATNSYIVL